MSLRSLVANQPLFIDQVAFGINPNSAWTASSLAAGWSDISYRVQAVQAVTQGRQYELATTMAGSGSYLLRNDDEALNPANAGGAYAGGVLPYRMLRSVGMFPTAGNICNSDNAAPDGSFAAYDPSFESGTSGWVGAYTTLSQSTAQAWDGTHSLKLAWQGNITTHTAAGTVVVGPCAVGMTYTFSVYVWVSSGTMVTAFEQVTGTYGTSTTGTGAWQRVSVTFVATQNVHTVGVTNAANTGGTPTVGAAGGLALSGSAGTTVSALSAAPLVGLVTPSDSTANTTYQSGSNQGAGVQYTQALLGGLVTNGGKIAVQRSYNTPSSAPIGDGSTVAIQQFNIAATSSWNGTAGSLAMPAVGAAGGSPGTQSNTDWCILAIAYGGSASSAISSVSNGVGTWAVIAGPYSDTSTGLYVVVYAKQMTATDAGTSITWTSAVSGKGVAAAVVYRGVDGSTPPSFSVAFHNSASAAANNYATASGTGTGNGWSCEVVAARGTTTTLAEFTAPTGLALRAQATGSAVGSGQPVLAIGDSRGNTTACGGNTWTTVDSFSHWVSIVISCSTSTVTTLDAKHLSASGGSGNGAPYWDATQSFYIVPMYSWKCFLPQSVAGSQQDPTVPGPYDAIVNAAMTSMQSNGITTAVLGSYHEPGQNANLAIFSQANYSAEQSHYGYLVKQFNAANGTHFSWAVILQQYDLTAASRLGGSWATGQTRTTRADDYWTDLGNDLNAPSMSNPAWSPAIIGWDYYSEAGLGYRSNPASDVAAMRSWVNSRISVAAGNSYTWAPTLSMPELGAGTLAEGAPVAKGTWLSTLWSAITTGSPAFHSIIYYDVTSTTSQTISLTTTQATATGTSAQTFITLTSGVTNPSLLVGMAVSGTGIGVSATISSFGAAGVVNLSVANSGTVSGTITFTLTGSDLTEQQAAQTEYATLVATSYAANHGGGTVGAAGSLSLSGSAGTTPPGGGSASVAYADAYQVELQQPGTTYPTAWSASTAGPQFYADFAGYLERWPEQWRDRGYYGYLQAPVVDLFALLPRTILGDVVTNEIMVDGPQAYYPMTDQAKSAVVAEYTGNAPAGVVYTAYASTVGVSPSIVIGSTTSVTYETFPSVQVTLPGGVLGPFLQLGDNGVVSGGGAEMAIYLPAGNTSGEGTTLWWQNVLQVTSAGVSATAWATQQLTLQWYPTGIGWQIAWQITNPGGNTTVIAYLTPGQHHLAWGLAADNQTMTLYVDGVLAGTTVATSNLFPLSVGVSGYQYQAPTIGLPGYVGFAVAPTVNIGRYASYPLRGFPSAGRIAQHALAVLTAFAGEMSGTRYARVLSYSSANIPKSIDAGMTPMSAALGLGNTDLATALNTVVVAENGQHFVSRTGVLTFYGRARRYTNHTPMWVLGDPTVGGQIPVESDLQFDFDTQFVYNDVQSQAPNLSLWTFTDALSKQEYFTSQPLLIQPECAWDSEARDVATWTLQQYKDPHLRARVVTVDPLKTGAWPMALTVDQGDLVQLVRATPAFTMSNLFWVDQIARSRKPGEYTVTMLLTPYWTTTVWQLGDATYGVLGSTTTLAR